MKIIFIRHLPTPGNEKRQYIGSTDEDLSQGAVERFRKMQPDNRERIYPPVQYVIASPLKRCIRTAELIWPGQEILIEPMLRECDFGAYERKTYEELKNEPEYIRWMESGGMTAFPGGEDQTGFRRRCVDGVKQWIGRLFEKDADSAAFVVHGGTIMAALEALAKLPEQDSGDPGGNFYRWQAENGCGYIAEAERREWESGRQILKNIQMLKLCKMR